MPRGVAVGLLVLEPVSGAASKPKAAASINSIILDRVCPRLEPLEPSEREREREREGERRGSSESNTSQLRDC